MALLNHPMLREALGGWYVDVQRASGLTLTWGAYGTRKDAEAQAKRLRANPELLADRVRANRPRPAQREEPGQAPLFREEESDE